MAGDDSRSAVGIVRGVAVMQEQTRSECDGWRGLRRARWPRFMSGLEPSHGVISRLVRQWRRETQYEMENGPSPSPALVNKDNVGINEASGKRTSEPGGGTFILSPAMESSYKNWAGKDP